MAFKLLNKFEFDTYNEYVVSIYSYTESFDINIITEQYTLDISSDNIFFNLEQNQMMVNWVFEDISLDNINVSIQ